MEEQVQTEGPHVTEEVAKNETHLPLPKKSDGYARIKPQYVLSEKDRHIDHSFVAKKDKEGLGEKRAVEEIGTDENTNGGPPKKKIKLKGQNKNRPHHVPLPQSAKLCFKFLENTCPHGDSCRFSHNLKQFYASKPPDISDKCPLFKMYGKCRYGIACRFASAHLTEDLKNVVREEGCREKEVEANTLTKDLQIELRKGRFDFSKTKAVLKKVTSGTFLEEANCTANGTLEKKDLGDGDDSVKDRPEERKKVDFKDKLYLAPLTTVGNLPFRRICKEFGADITCGEMAMATNLLQGQQSEWALLKRHPSEDLFGVQICGSHCDQMTRCAELLMKKCTVDFVDVNMGCPIDFIYKKGAGSGLMSRSKKLDEIVYGMSSVLEVPLTLKMRAGIKEGKTIAKQVIEQVKKWEDRVALITLHPRSREQRYTKLADWDYVAECAKAALPIPLYGSGDILSFEEANLRRAQSSVSGLMIARGALIKPWIFTEIKEQRHWDISSSERMDILRKYVNYGLDHWGSDTEGVERTRRFFLEWLSFLHRYIPLGLLEVLPQRINERPPPYYGRDDLETLMSSPFCADWIKISEMLLGPTPEGFVFLPKHKANAYASGAS
ncbi:tRNA-dihydrouridine(47) synthase [NAD(P)(+)]-like [Ornithodoros turicata]|uniref:tRNA-dihydrouridine(47) synthase [NAD(P)(+)]-like n=1 Tax=Ornithodoros turicata TaxID=34597 RepID=UPI003139E3A9